MLDTDAAAPLGPESPAAAPLHRAGRQTLAALHAQRAAHPGSPNLSEAEYSLLAACGLAGLSAVRRELRERALLAAYDGAPNALYTTHREQALETQPAGSHQCAPPPGSAVKRGVTLETALQFEPDTGRVCLRYSVVCRSQSIRAARTHTGMEETSDFYAVTFNAHTGRVAWREFSSVGQHAGHGGKPRKVAVEPVAHSGR